MAATALEGCKWTLEVQAYREDDAVRTTIGRLKREIGRPSSMRIGERIFMGKGIYHADQQ